MAELATVDLDSLLDGQKLRAPAILFVVVATLALVSDGYDLSAMGYVAPELVRSWHVAQPDLVPVFSAGIVGLLVGAPLLGFFGDRFGRKKAILLGLCIIGALTLASALARSLPQLVVLRFLTGIGLGGLNANIIALAAEIAPRRMRGAVLVLVSFGMPAGFALSGLAAAGLLLAPAAVLGLGALCCGALAVLCIRRYGGTQLGEVAVPPTVLPRRGGLSGPADATAAPANRLAPRRASAARLPWARPQVAAKAAQAPTVAGVTGQRDGRYGADELHEGNAPNRPGQL